MNRPLPHISQTLQQRRALAHYSQVAADAEAYRRELDRAQRIVAEHETEQLLDRVRQSGTGECDEGVAEQPAQVSMRVEALVIALAASGALWVLIAKFMGWLA